VTGSRRRRDVQGLRGAAVLLVVSQHVLAVPVGGFVGVDVFFVISGYVITRSLLAEWRATGTIDVATFLTGRARRLLPSAMVVLAVTLVGAVLVFHEPRAWRIGLDALAAATSAANWHALRAGADYFGADGTSPLLHFWSLAVEEQFYVVFPFLLVGGLVLARRTRHRSAVVSLVVAATTLSLAIAVLESALRPAAAYFTPESRAWEFGVGALVALLAPRLVASSRRVRQVVGTAGALGIVVSAVASTGASFPFPGALLPVLASAAVLASGEAKEDSWSSRVLGRAPLVRIGDLSYVLYLWHLPVLSFVGALAPRAGVTAVPVVLVVTAAAAIATHRFVEEPLRHGRRAPRHGVRRAVAAGLVAVVVVGSAAQVVGWPQLQTGPRRDASRVPIAGTEPFGSLSRLSSDVDAGLSAPRWPETDPDIGEVAPADAEAARLSSCLHDPRSVDAQMLRDSLRDCSWGPSDGPVVAVFGDSIALGWTAAAIERYAVAGWRVVAVGLQSCAPSAVAVADRTGRPDFVGQCWRARAVATRFLTGLGVEAVLTSSSVGAFDRQPAESASGRRDAWHDGVVRALRPFVDLDVSVFVLGAPPEGSDPSTCATRFSTPRDCETEIGSSLTSMAAAERAAVHDLGGSARYVRTDRWFCDGDGRCPLLVDGTLVRADHGHLTTAFSARLAPLLPLLPVLPEIP
jgi:peptidoglycan/LPS O-acetylase OafA/YrhL